MRTTRNGGPNDVGVRIERGVLSSGLLELVMVSGRLRPFPARFHDTFALGVVEHGTLRLRSHHGEWLAVAGDVIALGPREVYRIDRVTTRGYGYAVCHPLAGQLAPLAGIGRFHTPVLSDPGVARLLRASLRRLRGEPGPGEAEAMLLLACEQLAHTHARPESSPPKRVGSLIDAVHMTRANIDAGFRQAVPLDPIASACGLSALQVKRAFRQSTGIAPHAYLLQLRVNLAQTLLAGGGTVAEVARTCGFSDAHHLTRSFRRALGLAPTSYRRSVAASAHRA